MSQKVKVTTSGAECLTFEPPWSSALPDGRLVKPHREASGGSAHGETYAHGRGASGRETGLFAMPRTSWPAVTRHLCP